MSNPLYEQLFGKHDGQTTPFLVLEDGAVVTHADFLDVAARFAHVLTRAGMSPGDRLAAQVEKSSWALALYAACVQSGIVILPLNTAYTVDELTYFIEDSGARTLVCDARNKAAFAAIGNWPDGQLETLNSDGSGSLSDQADLMPSTYPTIDREENELAALLYTSGTTGRSKGAMLSQGNLLSNALILAEAWRFDANDVLLHVLPIFHTHGLFVATNVTLIAGGSMIFPSEVRSRPGYRATAGCHHPDGRSDILYAPAGFSGVHGRPDAPHAPLYFRKRTAAGGDPCAI